MVTGHSVPGYFGPWSFWLGTFQSLVISALGHFSHRSFGSWVISAQVHAKNILVQGHSPRTFRSLAILGSSSFRFLVIWPKLFWANVISVPGYYSPVISVPGHFGPQSLRSLGHFGVVTFWSQVILVPGHIDPGSFLGIFSFWLGTFRSLVISALGSFTIWSFGFQVVSAWDRFNPWSFRDFPRPTLGPIFGPYSL